MCLQSTPPKSSCDFGIVLTSTVAANREQELRCVFGPPIANALLRDYAEKQRRAHVITSQTGTVVELRSAGSQTVITGCAAHPSLAERSLLICLFRLGQGEQVERNRRLSRRAGCWYWWWARWFPLPGMQVERGEPLEFCSRVRSPLLRACRFVLAGVTPLCHDALMFALSGR